MRFLPALLLALALPAQARKKAAPPPEYVPPTSNFYLRTAFDTDPSVYLGRFVPDDAVVPDESAARKTACSQYVGAREVGGGGVDYDEVFSASVSAALGFGVPQTDLAVGGQGGQQSSLRAHYVLTRKFVADIDDPVAFSACCRQSPGECTGRFVGEFLEGTGSIWTAKGSDLSGSALKALKGAGLEVEASRGVYWARARTFPNPVSFAFKLTEVPEVDCAALVNNPPQTDRGVYFGALSDPQATERLARDAALAGAREQAVRWLGEQIATGSVQTVSSSGSGGAPAARIHDEQFVRRAAEGVARYVKDELSCVERQPGTTPSYVARTLAFMPKEAVDEAAKAAFVAE